jgi:hypothetical protein
MSDYCYSQPLSAGSLSLAGADIISRQGNILSRNPASSHADSSNSGLAAIAFTPFKGGLENANEYAAGACYTIDGIASSIGVSFGRLGYKELYSNSVSSLTFSHHFSPEKMRRASLALRMRYEETGFTSEYEKLQRVFGDFGGEMIFTDEFSVGFTVLNLIGSTTITEVETEAAPKVYSLGVEYSPNAIDISAYTTIEKKEGRDLIGRFGLEYSPFSLVKLRAGTTSLFESYHFGFGVVTSGLLIEGASILYSETGVSASVGVSYAW